MALSAFESIEIQRLLRESVRSEMRRVMRNHKEQMKKALLKVTKEIEANERSVRAGVEQQLRVAAQCLAQQRAALDSAMDSVRQLLTRHLEGFVSLEELVVPDEDGTVFGLTQSMLSVKYAHAHIARRHTVSRVSRG